MKDTLMDMIITTAWSAIIIGIYLFITVIVF